MPAFLKRSSSHPFPSVSFFIHRRTPPYPEALLWAFRSAHGAPDWPYIPSALFLPGCPEAGSARPRLPACRSRNAPLPDRLSRSTALPELKVRAENTGIYRYKVCIDLAPRTEKELFAPQRDLPDLSALSVFVLQALRIYSAACQRIEFHDRPL